MPTITSSLKNLTFHTFIHHLAGYQCRKDQTDSYIKYLTEPLQESSRYISGESNSSKNCSTDQIKDK